jgi:outer membrane protein assembly factor BamE (lipoprotein component of BamABCDE complex)
MSGIAPRIAALALLAGLVAGCAVESVNVEKPEELIPDRTAAVETGKTYRAWVRAVLGEPYISSDSWRFDLFR